MGYFAGIELTDDMFMQDTLNDFISDGQKMATSRNRIAEIFDKTNSKLRDNLKHRDIVIFEIDDVECNSQY
jgi:fumarylacetoacetase